MRWRLIPVADDDKGAFTSDELAAVAMYVKMSDEGTPHFPSDPTRIIAVTAVRHKLMPVLRAIDEDVARAAAHDVASTAAR